MRVAVAHTDSAHPNAGVAAYRFGRVQDTSNPLTGEPISADALMVALLDQARAEFPEPDYRVVAQRLSEPDESGEGTWQDLDESALRARAAGQPVDVPLADVSVPVEAEVGVAAAQDTQAATDGGQG